MRAVIVPGRDGNLRGMRGGKDPLFRGAGAAAKQRDGLQRSNRHSDRAGDQQDLEEARFGLATHRDCHMTFMCCDIHSTRC
jgi:hypothetical protein